MTPRNLLWCNFLTNIMFAMNQNSHFRLCIKLGQASSQKMECLPKFQIFSADAQCAPQFSSPTHRTRTRRLYNTFQSHHWQQPLNPKHMTKKLKCQQILFFPPHNTFWHFFPIQPVTKTDICDPISISLNFSLPNSIEFGAKQWRVVVGVHKLSDKKIAPTFLGWGGIFTPSLGRWQKV